MRHFDEADVIAAMSPARALTLVREAHLALVSATTVNEPRVRCRTSRFALHSMSALDSAKGYAAIKVYTSLGAMISSQIQLFRLADGALLATFAAKEIGRLRTGAAAVLGAQACGITSPAAVGIIGAGYQGEGALLAAASAYPEARLNLASRSPDHARKLATEVAEKLRRDVMPLSIQALVEASSVVITATTSATPVVEESWLDGVQHISAIGANSLLRRELPPKVIEAASLVVVDEIETAKREGGNLLSSIETGRLSWNKVRELGPLLTRPIDRSGVNISIFSSHGLAVQDLYLAIDLYENLAGNS